jgi:hypothetical protein
LHLPQSFYVSNHFSVKEKHLLAAIAVIFLCSEIGINKPGVEPAFLLCRAHFFFMIFRYHKTDKNSVHLSSPF